MLQSQRGIHLVWHAEGSEFCLNKILINLRDEEARYPHKVAMVMGGECEQFFPMSLIKKRKQIKKNVRNSRGTITLKKINIDTVFGVVDTSGYVRLADLDRKFCVQEALGLIENVVMLMKRAEDYLLFPEDYLVTLDTVYLKHAQEYNSGHEAINIVPVTDGNVGRGEYRNESRKVRLAFVPTSGIETGGGLTALYYFIMSLQKCATAEGKFYIERLAEEAFSKNGRYKGQSYERLIGIIEKLKSEAYANGVR